MERFLEETYGNKFYKKQKKMFTHLKKLKERIKMFSIRKFLFLLVDRTHVKRSLDKRNIDFTVLLLYTL